MKSTIVLAALLAASLFPPATASAQETLQIGTTANAEVAAVFVATEEGIFARNGIPAAVTIVALNPNLPAAILSGSIQIGAPTPTVFAQAVDNGLDLVAIAGVSVISPSYHGVAIASGPSGQIKTAKDLVGKTVAVPGLNAVLHIALELWLESEGVNPKDVRFVEATLPNMGDLLKSGQVDAAVVIDPFLPRLVEAGTAKIIAYFFAQVAAGQQTMFYVANRDWVVKNPQKVAAFRTSLTEAADFISANPDKARIDINKYFKLPPAAIEKITLPATAPHLENSQLMFWADVMKRFGLLDKPIDPATVIAP